MTETAEPTTTRARRPRSRAAAAASAPANGPLPDPAHPRDAGPARPQLLGARAGHPDARRPRRARGVPVRQAPGLHRGPRRAPARRLEDHACSLGRRGGFITRLRDGTWVGHIAEHVALELQNLAGTDVRHGKTRSAGPARPVQRHLRVPRGGRRARGRPDGRRARQPPRRPGRPRGLLRLRAPSSRGSSGSPSARPSAPRRRRSSTRP